MYTRVNVYQVMYRVSVCVIILYVNHVINVQLYITCIKYLSTDNRCNLVRIDVYIITWLFCIERAVEGRGGEEKERKARSNAL